MQTIMLENRDYSQGISELSSLESYKHKYAKKVLTEWLRESAEQVGYDNSAKIWDLCWRVNRGAPTYGVYEEYPISKTVGCAGYPSAWDETKWGRIPTYQELVNDGEIPQLILDIAIQEKGDIIYGFEVVHKNSVNPRKAYLLYGLSVQTFEISADWILRQVKNPNTLKILRQHGRGYVYSI